MSTGTWEPDRYEIGLKELEIDGRPFPSTTTERARRHILETGEPFVIYTYGGYVADWVEHHCVLTDSDYAGQPFRLMPWQRRLLYEMFEVIEGQDRDGNPRWIRKHLWALVGIPKKNGKTELVGALGEFFLVGDDEPSPNVIAAAASEEQAGLVFTAAKRMAEWSDTLAQVTDTQEKKILVPGKRGAQLVKVAAAAGTNDGKNVYVTLIDELHEWVTKKHTGVFTVLTQGGGARVEPFNVMITTAGSEEDSRCFEFYEHGVAVRAGEVVDDRFYMCWYEAPEELDYRSPEARRAANPSFGLILQDEFYEDMLTKRTEAEYRRYFLNQWTEHEDIWEAATLWDDRQGRPELKEHLPTFVGVDIGRKNDSTAVVAVQWDQDEERLHVWQKLWMNPYPPNDTRRGSWKLNIAEVENELRRLREDFVTATLPGEDTEDELLPGPAFAYDPHFFSRSADDLEDEGLNMVEFPQTDTRMVPASQRLFELIKSGALVHDGNPAARRQIRSVVAKEKERGWRISKPAGSRKHVDFAIALAMAAYLATEAHESEDGGFNVW